MLSYAPVNRGFMLLWDSLDLNNKVRPAWLFAFVNGQPQKSVECKLYCLGLDSQWLSFCFLDG